MGPSKSKASAAKRRRRATALVSMSWWTIVISARVLSIAEAWAVIQRPSQPSPSFVGSSAASSLRYDGATRSGRVGVLSSSSSASADDANSLADSKGRVDDQEGEPVLRALYDAPPRLPPDGEGDANSTSPITLNEGWATEVTSGTLETEEGSSHVLYYEVHRRYRLDEDTSNTSEISPKDRHGSGLTALFLHGGPGAACFPNHVRFFSPELYETVVLLDQRGCGRSTPLGETNNNTLELLVGDVERLRVRLLQEEGVVGSADEITTGVRPWDVVLGGSWGCTLALAYAHTYPEHVRAMVLRGVCLFRPREIDWLFGDPPSTSRGNGGALRTSNLRSLLGNDGGARSTQAFRKGEGTAASTVEPAMTTTKETAPSAAKTAAETFPKEWQEFVKGSSIASVRAPLQQSETAATTSEDRGNDKNPRSILKKYYHLLLGSDPLVRLAAVKSWMRWEMGIYSSGFRGSRQSEKARDEESGGHNNTLLVWSPDRASWTYEDARVRNNRSVASIDENPSTVEEVVAQSLRRFTPTSSQFERQPSPESDAEVEPIPVRPAFVPPGKSIPKPQSKGDGGNSTFDPTTYIPAQSMLTCYYSTNDEYCIGPYKSFLSLSPPPSVPSSSWYSSMPRTIAIQGGDDAICPVDTALDLHRAWNGMELRIALGGGHSMYDSVIAGEVVKALDRLGRDLAAERRC